MASANARANPKVAAEVPAAVKKKGTLIVATDASFAPNEFIAPSGHAIVGMDVDLARALANVMGLRVRIVNAMFDRIIPSLASHKYDLGMSSFTDTKARERVVDFVTYYSAGTSFFVKLTAARRSTRSPICAATPSQSKRARRNRSTPPPRTRSARRWAGPA